MVGEMEEPLVIGKTIKKCFKNLKINNLPVIWRNNKKAWLTAATMEEWLHMFIAKMKAMKYSKIFSVLFASKTNELLNQMRYFV
jgi:hypothetical protein